MALSLLPLCPFNFVRRMAVKRLLVQPHNPTRIEADEHLAYRPAWRKAIRPDYRYHFAMRTVTKKNRVKRGDTFSVSKWVVREYIMGVGSDAEREVWMRLYVSVRDSNDYPSVLLANRADEVAALTKRGVIENAVLTEWGIRVWWCWVCSYGLDAKLYNRTQTKKRGKPDQEGYAPKRERKHKEGYKWASQ